MAKKITIPSTKNKETKTMIKKMQTTNKKDKEVKIMKTDIVNLADALEKLIEAITGYLTESAKCTISVTCYDSPYKAPASTQDLKVIQDPVKAFLEDILQKVYVDVLPWGLLFHMYQAWTVQTCPGMSLQYVNNRNYFISEIRRVINLDLPVFNGWHYTEKRKRVNKCMEISVKEPLLEKFNCRQWMKDPENDHVHLLVKEDRKGYGHFTGLFRESKPLA